jgi:hypothetical protein
MNITILLHYILSAVPLGKGSPPPLPPADIFYARWEKLKSMLRTNVACSTSMSQGRTTTPVFRPKTRAHATCETSVSLTSHDFRYSYNFNSKYNEMTVNEL